LTIAYRHEICRCYKIFRIFEEEGGAMTKSPCLGCEHIHEDKNKCLENCEKLKEYQEYLLKMGIYAKI
jgi:hypothetical protein